MNCESTNLHNTITADQPNPTLSLSQIKNFRYEKNYSVGHGWNCSIKYGDWCNTEFIFWNPQKKLIS